MMANVEPEIMFDQIDDLPALTQDQTPHYARLVAEGISKKELQTIERVIIVGDGDSFHAACAAEMAFDTLAQVSCEPYSAQRFLDYKSESIGTGSELKTLLIAISASGTTRRVMESIERARRPGLLSLGLTTRSGSVITEAADRCIVLALPEKGIRPGPGIRSFNANLMGLYLLAVQMGEARGHFQAQGFVDELVALADVMAATIEAGKVAAKTAAQAHSDADVMMWLGSGPSYGSAIFSAAKVVEAAGVFAVGQDLEEWSHVEFFAHPLDYPTVIIAPPGNSYWRAVDTAEMAKTYGHRVTAVVQQNDQQVAEHCHHLIPVMGDVPEPFSPLVYTIASGIYAAYLTESKGRSLFQSDNVDFREKNRLYQLRDRIH